MKAYVHPRIMERHPILSEEDVAYAFKHSFIEILRPDSENFPEFLWIGLDEKGREIEMVGTLMQDGYLIYHANTPLSKTAKRELKDIEKHREQRR